MRHEVKKQVKKDLAITKKAVVSIGDSFTEGQGAIDQNLYLKYNFVYKDLGAPMELEEPKKVIDRIVRKHPSLVYDSETGVDFYFMEHQNSYVSVLCRDFFRKAYTPVNLGIRGKGNRASIKSLYFHNDLKWSDLDDIVVVYCPTESSRFDFASDSVDNGHHLFTTIWPHPQGMKKKDPNRLLWEGYAKMVYSSKSAMVEEILNIIDLQNWCKIHSARLIITPAFSHEYSKSNMEKTLSGHVVRTPQGIFDEELPVNLETPDIELFMNLIDSIDFKNWFCPDNCETFMDMCLKQEGLLDESFYNFFGPGSPDNWVTKCGHPSAKSHRLFAKKLYEYITGTK